MNAERLLTHYEKIADAPDAIPRLRRFVLDLAVQGKLVTQDPNDEPASELLKRIAAEKMRLVEAKAIRKPKALPPKDPDTFPFTLPKGWRWACVDELSPRSLTDGDWIETKDQSADGNVRLIQLADVGVGTFLDKSSRFITAETEVRLNCTRLAVGDVLIARLPNPIGRSCVFPDIGQPAITAVDVAILHPDSNVSADYIVAAMNAPPTRIQIEVYGKGATRFRVSTGHLKTVLIPLPPLAEQHRIVAKVDELMSLCDQLEAARAEREAVRDRMAAASLARLTAPDADPAAFRGHAAFTLDNLTPLTTRPDQIKPLRQTILNLAVRGKLVAQDPDDEPASELLKRIAEARTCLVKAGSIRSKKQPAGLNDVEIPFVAPSGWQWVSLAQVFVVTGGIQKTPARTPKNRAFPYLGVGNVYRNRIDLTNLKHFELQDGELEKFGLQPFDVMVVEGNGSASEIGRCAMWEGQVEDCVHQNHLIRCRPIEPAISRYGLLCLNSPQGINEMRELAITSAGLYNLSVGKISKIPIPLPPLAEQHRIVAKVDELMTLCDLLEATLAATDTTRACLLDALLHEALEPGASDMEAAE